MDNGQGEVKSVSYSPKVGFDNNGGVVVKNRAYRRMWKNRAMMENRPSKKYYTTKQTHIRIRNGKRVKVSKNAGKQNS